MDGRDLQLFAELDQRVADQVKRRAAFEATEEGKQWRIWEDPHSHMWRAERLGNGGHVTARFLELHDLLDVLGAP